MCNARYYGIFSSHPRLLRIGGLVESQLLKGVLDVGVLAVIDREDSYGYDVVRTLRESGLDGVGDASVYGTLRRLFRSGYLTSYVVASDEGPNRKYYGINDAGRDQLESGRKTWSQFVDSMSAVLAESTVVEGEQSDE